MTDAYMRTAWVMGDAYIRLYCADRDTGLVADKDWQGNDLPLLSPMPVTLPDENPDGFKPLVNDCYLNAGVQISAQTAFSRRAIPGRANRKLVHRLNTFDDVTATVNSMFIDKSFEYETSKYFNPRQPLLLVIRFLNPVYSGFSPNTNDVFKLMFAKTTAFRITGQDVDVIQASVSFAAEQLQ